MKSTNHYNKKKNRIREALEKKKKRSMPLDDSSEKKVVKKLKSSKNDPSVDGIKMDISCKAQNSNITPKKDIETVMSPIDPITSQDGNFPMDL